MQKLIVTAGGNLNNKTNFFNRNKSLNFQKPLLDNTLKTFSELGVRQTLKVSFDSVRLFTFLSFLVASNSFAHINIESFLKALIKALNQFMLALYANALVFAITLANNKNLDLIEINKVGNEGCEVELKPLVTLKFQNQLGLFRKFNRDEFL